MQLFRKAEEMKSLRKNETSPYYNKTRHFYICSFGGSGSWMLVNYLANFGNAYHIHSRYPPKYLTYIGNQYTRKPVWEEWFNNTIIDPELVKNYTVIYVYRNPVHSIHSAFNSVQHLQHIQSANLRPISEVLKHQKDIYHLEHFFNNYTSPESARNYPILAVKYEDFFLNIPEFNESIKIPNIPELYPIEHRKKREYPEYEEYARIYKSLIDKMDEFSSIQWV